MFAQITSRVTSKVVWAGPGLPLDLSVAIASVILALFPFEGAVAQKMPANSTSHCQVGTYHLSDGRDVDISPDDENLEWRMKDGTVGELTPAADGSWSSTLGMTGRPDGKRVSFGDCAAGTVRFNGVEGHRIAFDVFETRFQGAGVILAGRLVMPKGKAAVPIVVLVHGADRSPALEGSGIFTALQRLFPSAGVGAFIYDK